MNIQNKLENWAKETLGEVAFTLVHPQHLDNGDFTLILARTTDIVQSGGVNNGIEEVVAKLEQNILPEISKIVFVAPRFINIFLSPQFFAETIKGVLEAGDEFGKSDLLKGEKIFIEHTQPNPFKEFHIGHMMNNSIGESISRIIKLSGADTKTCSYHGDKGLHVAKAVWAMKKGVDIKEAYAQGHKSYEESEDTKKEIIDINKNIYDASDEEINNIYDKGRKESFEYFESVYKRLDSTFDNHFYESVAGVEGKKLVEENVGKVFEEGDGGAIVFRGENFEPKTHTRVFINSEGIPTYEAKEVGLAKIKKDEWPYDKSITITANEQDSFFSVVEVVIGEVFPELQGKLKHLSHGILKLSSGKMSSRTGSVISAESLIEQVKEKVLEKIKHREFSDEEKNEIAEVVAIGAIKYSILRQAIGGDIIFDFDKSISFEGDSGPYIQYAHTRASSVLKKAISYKLEALSLGTKDWETREVEKLLYRFSEVVEKASRELSPHYLVTYLTELAGAFNSFYAQEQILVEGDPTSPYKLAITEAVAIVLKNGLNLLGIKVPERM